MKDNPALTAWIHDEKTIAEIFKGKKGYEVSSLDSITRLARNLRIAQYHTPAEHVVFIQRFFTNEVRQGHLSVEVVAEVQNEFVGILAILNEGSITCDGGDLLTFKQQFGIEWQARDREGV